MLWWQQLHLCALCAQRSWPAMPLRGWVLVQVVLRRSVARVPQLAAQGQQNAMQWRHPIVHQRWVHRLHLPRVEHAGVLPHVSHHNHLGQAPAVRVSLQERLGRIVPLDERVCQSRQTTTGWNQSPTGLAVRQLPGLLRRISQVQSCWRGGTAG